MKKTLSYSATLVATINITKALLVDFFVYWKLRPNRADNMRWDSSAIAFNLSKEHHQNEVIWKP